MAKEIMLFYRDDTYKVFHDREVANISKKDIKRACHALVAVKSGEVQRYLMVDPDDLITRISPGKFFYAMEFSAIYADNDIDPELYPMSTESVEIKDVFDFYDAIYFIMEMRFVYDVMNPDTFDEFRVLDIVEAYFDIPDSSIGRITSGQRVKKSKIVNPRDLAAEELADYFTETFGITPYSDKVNKKNNNRIHILKKHTWAYSESEKELWHPNKEAVSCQLESGAFIFGSPSMLESLSYILAPSINITMYDLMAVDPSYIEKHSEELKTWEIVDDAVVGYQHTFLVSRVGTLSFLVESDIITQCIKLCMTIAEYCNAEGVLYEFTASIEKPIRDNENEIPQGFLKSHAKIHFFYDFDCVNDKSILETFLIEFGNCVDGGFYLSTDLPF